MKKHFKDNFMTQNHSYLTEEIISDNLEKYFLHLKKHNFHKLICLWNNYVHNKIKLCFNNMLIFSPVSARISCS